MKRRKYEPSGGVVPIEWYAGKPPACFGNIVAELWVVEWSVLEPAELLVRARMVALSATAGGTGWVDWSAREVPDTTRWRRWFRPTNTTTRLTVTLEDWNA